MPYTEKTLYQWLKFNYGGPLVDLQRIEAATGAGIPDVNACAHGRELWLEGKVARYCRWYGNDEPGRWNDYSDALCFTVRRSQLAWMVRRQAANGLCWFYVAVPKGLAIRLWPLQQERRPARILAFSPSAVRQVLRPTNPTRHEASSGGTAAKVMRLEARFGPQEALRLDEWPLVESFLVKSGKAST